VTQLQPAPPRSRLRTTLVAPFRALALAFFALPICLALFVLFAVALPLTLIGVGALALPPIIWATRAIADLHRRLSRDWVDRPVPRPYRPRRRFGWGVGAMFSRTGHLLAEAQTWRDFLWTILNAVVGFLLGLLPLGLIAEGIYGWVLACGVWQPIYRHTGGEWYGFVHVTSWHRAGEAALLACGFVLLGLGLGPWILRAQLAISRALLQPTREAALQRRVETLTETRTTAVDASAAELRRIERDLHDGAQARLVALGMSLSAAEQLLESDPERARANIVAARQASVTALNELRDLVRGILPPVLIERGLGDAVRALALAGPVPTEVTVHLSGRLPDPVESAAYFAVSETLTNAVKHAAATRIWIDLRHDGTTLRITVGDDGRGGADPARGTGLAGLSARLATFDGRLAVSSPVGGPTLVTMELPCASYSPRTSSS
jgi:signal transduction histidine kinase